MKPIAMACQSGHGSSARARLVPEQEPPANRRMTNVMRGEHHAERERPGSASRIWRTTSPMWTPRNAQTSRASASAAPTSTGDDLLAPHRARTPSQDSSSASGTRSRSSCSRGWIAARSHDRRELDASTSGGRPRRAPARSVRDSRAIRSPPAPRPGVRRCRRGDQAPRVEAGAGPRSRCSRSSVRKLRLERSHRRVGRASARGSARRRARGWRSARRRHRGPRRRRTAATRSARHPLRARSTPRDRSIAASDSVDDRAWSSRWATSRIRRDTCIRSAASATERSSSPAALRLAISCSMDRPAIPAANASRVERANTASAPATGSGPGTPAARRAPIRW